MEENEKKEMSTASSPSEVVVETPVPIVQTPVESPQQVEAVSPTPVAVDQPSVPTVNPTPVPTPQAPAQPEIKTSGTATEEEIVIDATKPVAEVLDEYEIKRDVVQEQKKYKKNITFIIIVILLIVIFIVLMPFIAKQIGF